MNFFNDENVDPRAQTSTTNMKYDDDQDQKRLNRLYQRYERHGRKLEELLVEKHLVNTKIENEKSMQAHLDQLIKEKEVEILAKRNEKMMATTRENKKTVSERATIKSAQSLEKHQVDAKIENDKAKQAHSDQLIKEKEVDILAQRNEKMMATTRENKKTVSEKAIIKSAQSLEGRLHRENASLECFHCSIFDDAIGNFDYIPMMMSTESGFYHVLDTWFHYIVWNMKAAYTAYESDPVSQKGRMVVVTALKLLETIVYKCIHDYRDIPVAKFYYDDNLMSLLFRMSYFQYQYLPAEIQEKSAQLREYIFKNNRKNEKYGEKVDISAAIPLPYK